MRTLITNLNGKCLLAVSMKIQVDGLISIHSKESGKESLDKYFKGGEILIDTIDPLDACKKISKIIQGAKTHGEVFIGFNGDDLGPLLSFMANKEEVDGIFICYDEEAFRIPLLKLELSKTREKILKVLNEENLTAINIGKKVGISRAMVYKHLSGLIENGLVEQSQLYEKYSITPTGKMVII
ncbi:MAG: helix-turn-helix domain-containing protein [Methanomicrobiales archaeon]